MPTLHLHELADTGLPHAESHSPFCLKVHRALRLRGLPYERHHQPHPAAHGLTRLGQVPVLVIGEGPPAEVVADSTAILRRIGELSRPLEPLDPTAAAEAWLTEELADTAINAFLVAARWADDRNWPAVRAAYFGAAPWPVRALLVPHLRAGVLKSLVGRDVWRAGPDACWARFGRLLDQLDARAPRAGFWVCAEPTAADLALFGQLQSLRTELTPWQRGEVDSRRRLAAYLDRVDAATRGEALPCLDAPPDAGAHSIGQIEYGGVGS